MILRLPCRAGIPTLPLKMITSYWQACTPLTPHRLTSRHGRPRTAQVHPDDVEPVPAAVLAPPASLEALQLEADWVAGMLRCWLDEEWTPQAVHGDLGSAAAAVYVALRQQGQEEVGDVIIGTAQGLMANCDFREQFVGPFDVANKLAELLMLRQGLEVCCVGDVDAIHRYEETLAAEKGANP